MAQRKRAVKSELVAVPKEAEYDGLLSGVATLLEDARRSTARAVNSILTATYWELGRRIVEFEQGGNARADYGEGLLKRLGADLSTRFGRGFSWRNLFQMRAFYLGWAILRTPSGTLETRVAVSADSDATSRSRKLQTLSAISELGKLAASFPLSWSHYVRLLSVADPLARTFYETEAIRGGWSVRQLDRQISTQFYERLLHSQRKPQMLAKAHVPKPEDTVTVEEIIRDPYLLEFLNLKDEYSESELEEAIIRHIEWFLLELGEGFTFVARQKRIRIGDTWYRIDLLLYHRDLRCLVVCDLKLGRFTHGDAGQMNLYLNYVGEHLTRPTENAPVGMILCSEKNDAVVKYATAGIQTQVFASKYLKALPDPEKLREEIVKTQRAITLHAKDGDKPG